MSKIKTINASGKRKTAVARVTLKKGTGKVRINSRFLDVVEPKLFREKINEALQVADVHNVDLNVKVVGGGVTGQADAARVAISRALVQNTPAIKQKLLDYDRNLLVADVRRKETTKPNSHGKARSKRQKSYR